MLLCPNTNSFILLWFLQQAEINSKHFLIAKLISSKISTTFCKCEFLWGILDFLEGLFGTGLILSLVFLFWIFFPFSEELFKFCSANFKNWWCIELNFLASFKKTKHLSKNPWSNKNSCL